ncbi:hypothetical protein [Chitinimonas taiwanensis]|uniref:hypothetical protein n=1 Tax=Chitinimonas taiwanensis TaxID=240412 RepID=UPI0035B3CB0B
MNSNEDKPVSPSARPSLYKPDSTTSFSILDAATVQGKPKRAKPVAAEAAPPTPASRRRWPWAMAAGLLLAGVGAIVLSAREESEEAAPAAIAVKPSNPAAKPVAAPGAAVAEEKIEAVAKADTPRPALVEQLEAPSEKEFTPTGADPLSILEADHSKLDETASKPAASAKKEAATPAKPRNEPAKKPAPAAKVASSKAAPPSKPEAVKPHRDGDIDFMEAVLSRLPKPEPRSETTTEPTKAE